MLRYGTWADRVQGGTPAPPVFGMESGTMTESLLEKAPEKEKAFSIRNPAIFPLFRRRPWYTPSTFGYILGNIIRLVDTEGIAC